MRFALLAVLMVWMAAPPVAAGVPSYAELARGKTLVDAGDCVACHTNDPSRPFAGGRAVPTPFGTIFSANITPDRATGIGAWSDDDFYRALHDGLRPDGGHLYPAFPYPYFTRLTREDTDAIRAYLATLAPVSYRPPPNELPWPLSVRAAMRGWNMLFFDEGTYRPDPSKSTQWNRGAYLVRGVGHCGACHTPKNLLGGDETSRGLAGGAVQDWFAPGLAGDGRRGLGSWSAQDIVEYLKTGRNGRSGAAGLMSEVVEHSTSKLGDDDLAAIAAYLKDLPGQDEGAPGGPDAAPMKLGAEIYAASCAACHGAEGAGTPRMFPPLKGNSNTQQRDPTTVLRVILEGAKTVATDARPTTSAMPAYDWKLGDDEVAAVATYVRNAWGNAAEPVEASDVKALRDRLRADAVAGVP